VKKSSKQNQKWSVFCLLFLSQVLLLSSCNKNQDILPQNTISLKYNGETIIFDEIKVREDYLDLDAGKGIRAICSQNILDKNNFTYYIILDFKKISESDYRIHKIHFGTKKLLAKDNIRLELYFAELTDGFNKTNFQTSISSDDLEVEGTFSGRLMSLTAPEIFVNEGKYSFFLRTVKK
jgi:hypothetical protein